MKYIVLILFTIILTLSGFSQKSENPKYIFLFIGDGMGLVQSQITDTYLRTTKNDSVTYLRFPNVGLQTTYSLSSQITCSAASGTAFSCGQKTKAGYIGVDSAGKALKSIATFAKEKGYKVGIISSVSIDHATPSVFYAHDISRNSFHSIDMQLATSNFDFFGGGALIEPIKGTENAYTELKKNNYTLITSPDSLQYASKIDGKVCVFDLQKEFPYTIDNVKNDFTIANVTQAAIETLDNPKGFFMMVESGKIDWACHSNDAVTAIYETKALNDAVKNAIAFYKKHPNETLIIVTGDHETGGMAFGSALYPYYTNISIIQNQTISYSLLESKLKQEIETKKNEFTFTECMNFLNQYYSFEKGQFQLTSYDSLRIHKAFDFMQNPSSKNIDEETKLLYNLSASSASYAAADRSMAIINTVNKILAEKAGIGWTTYAHTGSPIPVYSIGKGSEKFTGIYDNTDIAKKIFTFLSQ